MQSLAPPTRRSTIYERRSLREVDIVPPEWEVARLPGFDITVQPRANLVRCDQTCVYGIVAVATHQELQRLYAHAEHVLGQLYLPEAVLTETANGSHRVALCYIAPEMNVETPEGAYLDRILAPAKEFGFPGWYIDRIESFRR